jgi:hypothetical protein
MAIKARKAPYRDPDDFDVEMLDGSNEEERWHARLASHGLFFSTPASHRE